MKRGLWLDGKIAAMMMGAIATAPVSCQQSARDEGGESPRVPEWASALALLPDSTVILDESSRDAIREIGLAWKVRDNKTDIEFLLVPPGEYRRGDLAVLHEGQENDSDRQGQHALQPHRVIIERPFYLGRTEVTIGQWAAFATESGYLTAAEDPSGDGGSTLTPVGDWSRDKAATWRDPSPGMRSVLSHSVGSADPAAQVSWEDAKAFTDFFDLRLPNEAEWEYAARAGTETKYWWGDQIEDGGGGKFNVTDQSASPHFSWPAYPFDDGYILAAPTDRETVANPWGFVDILGNLQEWMSNWYDPDFYLEAKMHEPINARFDDRADGTVRAYRGGCWDSSPGQANVYVRGGYPRHTDVIGFRVARDP